jgi:peptidyl-dipeptidase Dcp
MRKLFLMVVAGAILFSSCQPTTKKTESMGNPFFAEYNTPFQVPPFEDIKPEHYMPAFKEGMKQQKEAVAKIISNTEEPNFKNVIEALENSSPLLDKTGSVFYNVKGAHNNDELKAIAAELAPLMSAHGDDINLNADLFKKVKAVYDKKETLNLSTEETTLLENTYKGFVRGGANLEADKVARFREINSELSSLYIKFGENVTEENNRFEMVVENEADLAGLPEAVKVAAAETAKAKGKEGKWVFTIHKPSLLPVLENAENRELRKKMYMAYILKGDHNDSLDNKETAIKVANLRLERSKLLGYSNYAEYHLEKNMAKEAKNVKELLHKLLTPALKVAKQEVADMQKIVDSEGGKFKIAPWDYWYYGAKVKEQKYALNENDIRPYLVLENVRNGMFWLATQLYGVTFHKLADMPIYHPEVEVFEVKEANGDHVGVLYMDYHPRASKRSGAWCTSYRSQKYENGKRIAPVSSIVCNFTAPAGDMPALLSVDETTTLFHEFGHALDGLFADKKYSSLRVPRDFVELPSQVMENWAFEPEVLAQYAKHYKTGELIPAELVEKIQKAGKFNQGFTTTEYVAASLLDIDYHTITEPITIGANEFEKKSMDNIGLIPEIAPRYRSTYFQHIFTGPGYSSGYYSYIWAAVLDADAFQAFKETSLFDKETANKFRKYVLALGGTEDAMDSYVKFRGKKPGPEALLKRKGLN